MMKSSINAFCRYGSLLLVVIAAAFSPKPASAESDIQVITTIAPLYALTAGVMEGVAKPDLLLKQGETPHHYSLRPNDAERISKADIVISTNRAYAYYLAPLIKIMPERKIIFVEALAIPTMTLIPTSIKSKDKKALDGTYADMHFWLDPINAIAYTRYIAELLGNTDPKHAATYNKNAELQVARIKALDAAITELLGSDPLTAQYASYHPALAYFEKRYHIKGGKAITRTPETGASAAEAEALYQNIANGDLRCLFQEPEFSSSLLQLAAQQHDDKVRIVTLDPLGSTYTLNANLYDTLLMDIATHIKECSVPAGVKK